MTQALALAAALVFPPHMPNKQKVERVAAYFQPPPGSRIALDAHDLLHQSTKRPGSIFGEIMVFPPAGVCFAFQMSVLAPNTQVCGPKPLRFMADALDDNGRLAMKLWLPGQSVPVNLAWYADYSKGKVRTYGDESKDGETVFVAGCGIEPLASGDRLVKLTLLGKKEFSLLLPASGKEEPVQREIINLVTASQEGYNFQDLVKKKEQPKSLHWDIKGSPVFVLRPERVIFRNTPTPGQAGNCRYADRGHGPDSAHGLIECHQTRDHQYLKLPIPCLRRTDP